MKKKKIWLIISVVLCAIGVFLLVASYSTVTGAFIGVSASAAVIKSLFGVLFVISGMVLFATAPSRLEKITLSSAIKKSAPLLRLTQEAVRNKTVERELNHLVKELSRGNFEAGLGHPGHITGTDIFYLRGRKGARVYYHKIGENSYEIVAKSSKGRNQEKVIDKIKELYG